MYRFTWCVLAFVLGCHPSEDSLPDVPIGMTMYVDIGGGADASVADAGECRTGYTPRDDRDGSLQCDERFRICSSDSGFCLGSACTDSGSAPPNDCALKHLACCRRNKFDCATYSMLYDLIEDARAQYHVPPLCE